jgi:hypothetical protein
LLGTKGYVVVVVVVVAYPIDYSCQLQLSWLEIITALACYTASLMLIPLNIEWMCYVSATTTEFDHLSNRLGVAKTHQMLKANEISSVFGSAVVSCDITDEES